MTMVLVFAVAAAVTLLATPLMRRLALSVDLVDHPAARKVHAVPVPYLGGVAIALGTLAGLAVAPRLDPQAGVVAFGAALVGAVGLLDDDRHLTARTRLAVEVVAALAALAAGLRLEATGAAPVDAALTLVWIIGITNAANLLDNMDGLSAGVAASIAGSTLLLSAGGAEPWVPALAAAVTGACLAFLIFNVRPASIFMGDAGSLFLGYMLAVMTLAAAQPLGGRAGLAVPLLLAAVPIADTTTVVLARIRRGRSVAQGGKDHLSHRLVRRGFSPGTAVALLITVSLTVALAGTLTGRGHLSPWITTFAGAAIVAGLLAMTLTVDVYADPLAPFPRTLRLAATLISVGAVVAVPSGVIPGGGGTVPAAASRDRFMTNGSESRSSAVVGSGSNQEFLPSEATMLIAGGLCAIGAGLGLVVRDRKRTRRSQWV